MSVELYTTYFRNSCLAIPAKIEDGTMTSYGNYHTTEHTDTIELNGHLIQMQYQLRFEVSDRDTRTLHQTPLVQIEIEFVARPWKDTRGTSSTMKKIIKVEINAETLEEQIDEAIQTLERVIVEVKLPSVNFDFWKYVSSSMPDFEKQVKYACVNNNNRLSLVD